MLNNFIYSKLKSLFEEKLTAGEVPQEAIVFIEDTKEIWNHGTYFPSGKSVEEIENIVASSETVQDIMEQIAVDVINNSGKQDIIEDLDTIRSGAGLGATALQPGNGDGTKFLSDNGEYKEINIEQIKEEIINNGIIEFPSKYEFIDLGLPSNTKWATCNIGAASPEESGLYFAWGEIEGYTAEDVASGKKTFSWDDYKFGNSDALTKYNSTDGLIQLELVDDAAHQSDSTCRMPSENEMNELIDNTTVTWETLNGVNGRRFVSNINGNSIFIPAVGYCNNSSFNYVNNQGYYWGNGIVSYSTDYGYYLGLHETYDYSYATARNYGFPIRPVQPSNFITTVDLKNLQKTPYIWDGQTISETIFNELVKAVQSNREIILSIGNLSEGGGGFGFRMISATLIADQLCLTFCYTYSSPNYIFYEYAITSNSVELRDRPLYAKVRKDGTKLNTAYYTNVGLISNDTTITFSKNAYTSEYEGQFSFGDTVYTITFPSETTWVTYPSEFKPNTTYQFEITNNIGKLWEVGKGEVAYKSDISTKVSELEDDISIVTLNDSTPLVQNLAGDELIPIKQNGENKAVSVEQIKNEVLAIPSKYEFIDLGLPSGLKWATTNIGAVNPEDFGLYFAWGETQGYTAEDVTNKVKAFNSNYTDYKYCEGSSNSLTKYNNTETRGVVDNLTQLLLEDDAAYISDNKCRIPTKEECEELINNTDYSTETVNGIVGAKITSKINGNSIFIPYGGQYSNSTKFENNYSARIMTSSLSDNPSSTYELIYNSYTSTITEYGGRTTGINIRPVQPANTPTTINLKELKDKVEEAKEIFTITSDMIEEVNASTRSAVKDYYRFTDDGYDQLCKAVQDDKIIVIAGDVISLIIPAAVPYELQPDNIQFKEKVIVTDVYSAWENGINSYVGLQFRNFDKDYTYITDYELFIDGGTIHVLYHHSPTLETEGDGTKFLSDNGEYKIPGETISILYSDLINLKNNSQLIPGQKYRITDYVTTVSQNGVTSLEHPFDIVVTALNQQDISTEASAMQNESDTYFSTSDLSKWKLWYIPQVSTITNIVVDISSMGNPPTVALQNTDDPFIYNDIEYFAYKGSIQGIVVYVLSETAITSVDQSFIFVLINPSDGSIVELSEDIFITSIEIINPPEKGKIIRMIDEYENDCPYDFKNIKFDDYFTFAHPDIMDVDLSLSGLAHHNTIMSSENIYTIPINIFKSTGSIYLNKIGFSGNNNIIENYNGNLSDIYIGNNSCNNTIDGDYTNIPTYTISPSSTTSIYIGNNSCSNIISGNSIHIGNNSSNNRINRSVCVKIGDNSNNNDLELSCGSDLGNACRDNELFSSTRCVLIYSSGNKFSKNSNNCYLFSSNNNTINGGSSHLSDSDSNIIKGANNIFRNANSNVVEGTNNIFESYAGNNIINGSDCIFKQFASNNKFSRVSDGSIPRYGINNVIFDAGCSGNILWNEEYDSEESDKRDQYDNYKMKNIHITKGVNSSTIYIPSDALNSDCEIKVAKNSKGEIKIYCEADLIN